MSPRRAAALALPVALALLAGCTSSSDAEPDGRLSAPTAEVENTTLACPGQPDEAATGPQVLPALAFDCLGGGSVDFGRAPGVPTVVNIWASWCGPCREELPLMQGVADLGGDRLNVLGVVSTDGRAQATSFAADAGVTFPSAFDAQGDLAAELGKRALPVTYLVRADGSVAHTQIKPITSVDELRQLVATHLGVQL
ncbi:redoxin family protein [Modestobacter sp. I12A-02628]|uniref:TlpA family protein disulfide reductase n=1 Tax=Goekera deserti TaxID=2497753 RepID=A0A7K3WHD2_9ACTN|nr:TlpA disulfide reductase family protein [Goekera deserti]MPQ98051.1 redoxin family protein [Goekera deserti]NDI48698.1 redoxin family protein [Goekera deserti]NEL54923.1 TlpA family protein disulfide reductase [Goekera deserti]